MTALKAWMLAGIADPLGSTPGELAAYIRSEIVKWAKVIKLVGIKPE